MNGMRLYIILLVIVAAGILIGHLFFHKPATTESGKIAPNTVEIRNYAFTPQKIVVKKGTTVTWKNYDLVPHTVTIDDQNVKGPKSDLFTKDQTYTYTFSKSGTYAYHCEPHPYMKATVEVVD